MKESKTKKLIITSVLIAIGIILPSIFHLFNLGGAIFLPMHIPVIICGFILGRRYGLICGIIVPLLSSMITGMPPFFPIALTMCLELGAYGYLTGLLGKNYNLYVSLISAQIIGRFIGALASFILLSLAAKPFALSTYLTGAFITAAPGIVLQILIIPFLIMILRKANVGSFNE